MRRSDHLQGLEGNYAAPFIYCSAATKEVSLTEAMLADSSDGTQLLVKLERKIHRMNWQQGTVEASDCKYKEKTKLLVGCTTPFVRIR